MLLIDQHKELNFYSILFTLLYYLFYDIFYFHIYFINSLIQLIYFLDSHQYSFKYKKSTMKLKL